MIDKRRTGSRLTLEQIRNDYDAYVDGCANLSIYSRSVRLQREKVGEIDEYIAVLKGFKAQAVERNEEDRANDFFQMQCMLRSLQSSLNVWIAVKNEEFEDSWSHLVDAQEYKDIALKIADYPGIRAWEAHLQKMEDVLFPSPVYQSAALTESVGKCSICASNFGSCDHIENFVYMGQLCRRVDKAILETHHVAVVKDPKDRRCVVTRYSNDAGKMVNRFTLDEVGDKKEETDAMIAEGIILTTRVLDVD